MVKKTPSFNSSKKKKSEEKISNFRYELRSNASRTSNLSRFSHLNNLKFPTMRSIRKDILNSNRTLSNISENKSQQQEKKSNLSDNLYLNKLKKAIKDNESKLNYKLNFHLELKHNKTKTRYIYSNQAEYELISKYIGDVVKYKILKEYGMKILWLPNVVKRGQKAMNLNNFEYDPNTPQADIYVSPDFLEKNKKLLCLIQGTGDIRAGIWARSVCINENIYLGSVLPYLKMAKERDMQVIIFNPNERKDPISKEDIPEFSSMEKHCKYVWQEIIGKINFSNEIFIVAHSQGGNCIADILADGINIDRISKIALTDSVHGSKMKFIREEKKKFFNKFDKRIVNFIASDLNAGEFISSSEKSKDFVLNLSAGHVKHEYTTGCAIKEIFRFFDDKGEKYINDRIKSYQQKIRRLERENKMDLDEVLRKEQPLEKIYEVVSSSEDEEENEDKDKVNILLANNSISENIGIDFDYNSNNNDIEVEFKNSKRKSRLNSTANRENLIDNNLGISASKENQLNENEEKKLNFLKNLEKMAFSHLNENKTVEKNPPKILSSNDFYAKSNENNIPKPENIENILEIVKATRPENPSLDYSNISVEGSDEEKIQDNLKEIEANPVLKSFDYNIQIKENCKPELEIILNPLNENKQILKNTYDQNQINNSMMLEKDKNLDYDLTQIEVGNEKKIEEDEDVSNIVQEENNQSQKNIEDNKKHRIVRIKQEILKPSIRKPN